MRELFKTVWSYILAFTVNLKKTSEAVNAAHSAEEMELFIKGSDRQTQK